jgi:hypothetical protein
VLNARFGATITFAGGQAVAPQVSGKRQSGRGRIIGQSDQ